MFLGFWGFEEVKGIASLAHSIKTLVKAAAGFSVSILTSASREEQSEEKHTLSQMLV